MTALLLVLVCMLGLLPTAALAADAPSSIKLEDCTHNGVHYESPSLGTCWLHQMTFDYNQKSTIGFCAEHGKRHGLVPGGPDLGQPQAITNPTVQTMMAYYYAHTTGVFTDQAHALGVDEVVGQRLFLDYECLGAGYHLALSGWPADGPGHRLRRGVGLRLIITCTTAITAV